MRPAKCRCILLCDPLGAAVLLCRPCCHGLGIRGICPCVGAKETKNNAINKVVLAEGALDSVQPNSLSLVVCESFQQQKRTL